MDRLAREALSRTWLMLADFSAWLGIAPTLQDLAKAVILVVFVLAILMILGDVYRGEIQNKLHRIYLVPTEKNHPPLRADRDAALIRRNARREKDISLHVHQTIVSLPLDQTYSNVLLYARYRDFNGRMQTKRVEVYRVKFRVRVKGFGPQQASVRSGDHDYTSDEADRLVNEDVAQVVTMAGSRVDYVYDGVVDRLKEKLQRQFDQRRRNWMRRTFTPTALAQLKPAEFIGLMAKFHFPIDPYFLLYRHPDTNVRSTAWLTVLTSIFALFMQLIYSSGQAREVHGEMQDSASAMQSEIAVRQSASPPPSQPPRPAIGVAPN